MTERPFELGQLVAGENSQGATVIGRYDGDSRDYQVGEDESVLLLRGETMDHLRTVLTGTLRSSGRAA